MAKRLLARLVPCVAALLAPPVLAEIPEQLLESPIALGFGAPPTIDQPRLSPDGTRLLFLQQDTLGNTLLRMLDIATGEIASLLAGPPSGSIQWCEWANEDRLLCDLRRGFPTLNNDYQLYYGLNADGSELQEMRRNVPCRYHNDLRNDPPIDWLPDEPQEILIVCGGGAQRLDVYSGRLTDVSGAGQSGTAPYLFSNGHGLGSLYRAQEDDFIRWYARDAVNSSWERFQETNPLRVENPFRPLGFSQNVNEVFHIGWDSDSWAVYQMDLANDYENSLVFSHPTQDLELVDTLGAYDRVVSIPYLDGRPQRHFVDEGVAAVHATLSEQLNAQSPGQNVEIVDESWDGNKYLVKVRSPGRAGYFLMFDKENETVQGLAPEYAHLGEFDLAETIPVQFATSDGGQVSGHLTIPDGFEWPMPAVVIPRAAPSHLDVADPHYLVQFLAASGYAVLRLDSRGFEEYGGGGWLPVRAVAGWEQTADDLNDAVRYLASEGVTSLDQVCAAGRDYGAYSAFMTAIKYPGLFQCIVSIAGVSDSRATPGATAISRGLSGLSGNVLDESSALNRASEIQPPILLFHGRADIEFEMSTHAVPFVNALNRANKDVRFIEYEYANHKIERGPYRVDMLARTGRFLAEHIGVAEFEPGALDESDTLGAPEILDSDSEVLDSSSPTAP